MSHTESQMMRPQGLLEDRIDSLCKTREKVNTRAHNSSKAISAFRLTSGCLLLSVNGSLPKLPDGSMILAETAETLTIDSFPLQTIISA